MSRQYISPGADKPVNFPQYFAELLVMRKAKLKRVFLPKAFWRNKDPEYVAWIKEYKSQLFGSGALAKIYDTEAILKAFKHNEWVYSAHSPKFKELIGEEQRKLKQQPTPQAVDIIEKTDKVPARFGKPSKMNRLRD
jgi:hypothetical protein